MASPIDLTSGRAGAMNRVTRYSDFWDSLPGASEELYAFRSGGFYSQEEPPEDVPVGRAPPQDLGRLPAVCRYRETSEAEGGLVVDVMLHSHLSHAAKEYKRMLCAAEALGRAFDLGYIDGDALLATPLGRRAAVLLTLAGLLEFPADQNFLDGPWAMALETLRLPEISRTLVRGCITAGDQELDHYYGSRRSLRQLVEALGASDPVVLARLKVADPLVGRAAELTL